MLQKNYHVAVKSVFSHIVESSHMSDDELFKSLKKVNVDTGTFFDLEDLHTFITFKRYGKEYSESQKLSNG